MGASCVVVFAFASGCTRAAITPAWPTPTATPTATPTPTPIAPVDRWSPLITFDDGDPDPLELSYGSPTHMNLLPDGSVVAFAQFMRTPLDETTTKYFRSFRFTPPPDPAAPISISVTIPTEDSRQSNDILFCSGHALMDDGALFQAGGTRLSPYEGTNYSRIYDGSAWTQVSGDMLGGKRWYPAVTRLPPSGPGVASPLLITGGYQGVANTPNKNVEVYEPATGYRTLATNAPDGILGDAESDYTHVHLLPNPLNGVEALMIGGGGLAYGFNYSDPLLDGSLRFQLVTQRGAVMAGATSVLLPLRNELAERGRILIMGGSEEDAVLRRIDLFDVSTGTWQSIDSAIGRHHPSSVLLPDGTVLLLAGHGFPETFPLALGTNRPTIFDPETLEFRDGVDSGDDTVRGYHNAALLLPDGRVLLGSGRTYALPGHSERNDARYYYPAYLDPALEPSKPEILQAAATMTYDTDYAIDYDDEDGAIQRVVLMALGANTHSVDFNQRSIVLFAGESGASLSVRTPLNATIAPPGDYRLFVLRRVDGTLVPSAGRSVRLSY